MDTVQVILLIALIVVAGTFAFRYWIRSQAAKQAAEVTQDLYVVWAAQGPFGSGSQSAAAMRYACVAVRGPEVVERMADALAKHAHAFDSDPVRWEKLRMESLTLDGPKTQDHVTVAKGLAAADSLNGDLFGTGGHIEYRRQPDDRKLIFTYKKIWSDEDIQRKKKADAESSIKANGTSFLEGISAEQTLVWSDNPGAFEQHVRRRYNNPLFSESRRTISQSDIDAARTKDIHDAAVLNHEQRSLYEKLSSIGQTVSPNVVNQIRADIDTLIERAFEIDGPAHEILGKLQELRNVLIDVSRKSFAGYSELLAKLEDAEQAHKRYTTEFFVPFIAQMGREDSPIPADEVVPSLLMQDPDTIRVVMRWADAEFRKVLSGEAVSLLRESLQNGLRADRVQEIVAALEIGEEEQG